MLLALEKHPPAAWKAALTLFEKFLYLGLFAYGAVAGRMLHSASWRILLNGCSTLAIGLLISFIFH